MKRQVFLRTLRSLISHYGSENIVYFDETGFEHHAFQPYAWVKRGKKIYGDVVGKRYKRTNLLMAQRRKEWIAPMLFEGSCTSHTVNQWVKAFLLKALNKPSIVIMDNAPFHNKNIIKKLLEEKGHTLLPLPPYSPDFNPIEQTFGVLKRRRQSLPSNTPIEQLITSECYLE